MEIEEVCASNEIRTRVTGFKVQCADHYTMEAKNILYRA